MNSLELSIPFWGTVVINKGTDLDLQYPININGSPIGIHKLTFHLREDDLELRTNFSNKEVLPQEDKPQASMSLTEQVSKLPFKEQNALYKLMNTWGCRMER